MGAIYGIYGQGDAVELKAIGARLSHRGARAREGCVSPTLRLGERFDRVAERRDAAGPPLVLDGWLDNLHALRRRVGRRDSTPLDVSAMLYRLFEIEGVEMLGRLDGQFALALWDAANERLILARDRFAARPLYYAPSPASTRRSSPWPTWRRRRTAMRSGTCTARS